MAVQQKTINTDDASGRGNVEGYKVNFPPMIRPYTQAQIDAVVEVMSKVQGQTQGPYMKKFEADFKAKTGANHCFAVDNCTNALSLAAILCRLKQGDEVIIPSPSYFAYESILINMVKMRSDT